MTEEYYDPDPNAPIYHKLNPCHCDHFNFLNRIQYFSEAFASHCQCCSGVRIILLMAAFILGSFNNATLTIIGTAIFLVVLCAVVYGATASIMANRRSHDNSDAR